ncbi:hypothetical protein ABEX77_20365 [Bacillus subtilis]
MISEMRLQAQIDVIERENKELRRRNEELGQTVERQNKQIISQNWRLLFFASSWIVYGIVSAIKYFLG